MNKQEAEDLVKKHGSVSAAARAAGIPRSTLRHHLAGSIAIHKEPLKEESIERKVARDDMSLTYLGKKIRSPEELLKECHIDLRIWEIVEAAINNWEVGGKRGGGQGKDGRWKEDKLWKMPLLQIKVKLRRKAPKPIQDAILDLLKDKKLHKLPPLKRTSLPDPHLLEVSINDAHFGKLCLGKLNGCSSYDLNTARHDYVSAVDELLLKARTYSINKILFPIGNDFFHVDNWVGETANGTRVSSTDDVFQEVFKVGCNSVEYAIRRCREVADVEVLWVPGNHDRATSWYLTMLMQATFKGDPHVHVDSSNAERKYRSYGVSLLGFTHGEEISMRDLPLIMATDVPDAWAAAKGRHWRLAHWHKKKVMRFVAADSFNGVTATVLPSLSGTDLWHYRKGFVNTARTAEATLWSEQHGLSGYFSTNARSAA